MKIAIVTLIIGKEYARTVKYGLRSKYVYSKKHGYDLIVGRKRLGDLSRPAAWSKILLIEKILTNNSYDGVFYIDADALIMNKKKKILDFIKPFPNKDFIICRDSNNLINTGVFFLRNCEWSKEFLRRVYNETTWIDHVWYENKPIIHLWETNEKIRNHTQLCYYRQFNTFLREYKNEFIIHFASISGKKLKHLMFYFSLPFPNLIKSELRKNIVYILKKILKKIKNIIF